MPRVIWLILFLALIVRFLYFPDNINFSYDQARDSFASLDILKGNLKIVGPPTTISDKVFHGVLFYYILAPIYFLSGNNPEVAAAVLRVGNAVGVLLVFAVAANLFNKTVGLLAAFLYAISFEQTQYSLFFGHPALGVMAVLLFYWGLSQLIFKKRANGMITTLAGLGLAIQFEDVSGLLILNLILFLLVFIKNLKILNLKILMFALGVFILTISTFILSEFKYSFRMTTTTIQILKSFDSSSAGNFNHIFFVVNRLVKDNFLNSDRLVPILSLILIILIIFLLIKKNFRQQSLFLILWFFGGLIPDIISKSFSYYYTPGMTVSLLILAAFLIYKLSFKSLVLSGLILLVVIFSNLSQIVGQNYKGVNTDILIQPEFNISQQKRTLDYIYQKAAEEEFSVSAITIPFNVKTTWDYLFNWYGLQKYHYLPIWGHEAASGFYGNLEVEIDRARLPDKRFLIIEPVVGINQDLVDNFIEEENYFSKILEERQFGTIKVQERERI